MSGGIYVRIVLLVAAFWAAIGVASPARAQAGLAGAPLDACVSRVRSGDTAAVMFGAAARYDCATRQIDFGSGDYWVRSGPLPAWTADARREARVRIGSLTQRALTLNILYADGRIVTIPTTSATLGRFLHLGAIVEMVLPERAAPPVRLLWRVDGSANLRGILVAQRISDEADSFHASLTMASIYAAFIGICFALIVYNLALWGALRHRFQLAYCAMVAAMIGYTITSSGVLAWIVPGIDNNDRIRLNYVLLGLAAASAIAFARSFFEARVFAGWLGRASRWAIVPLLMSGITFAAVSHIDFYVADRMASLMFLTGLSITGPILWQAGRRGSRYLGLFALAWAVPILFAAARILAALHLFSSTFWLDNSTVLSLAVEALVSSLAIAYRVRMLSRERDDALASELQARHLADIDPLTGLLNRRAFLDRAIGSSGTQMLHLIDIDHFKSVNETLGHDGGDEVLRIFARTLRTAAPKGALIARLGGEEFAIALPLVTALDPDALLARLRSARMPFDLRVTASIGNCAGPLNSEADWKLLYRTADRALYEAKTAGRDRSRDARTTAIAA